MDGPLCFDNLLVDGLLFSLELSLLERQLYLFVVKYLHSVDDQPGFLPYVTLEPGKLRVQFLDLVLGQFELFVLGLAFELAVLDLLGQSHA